MVPPYYGVVASWTDGAAYAPLERPDGFAMPETDPLDVAAAPRPTTAGPVPPPRSFEAPRAIPLEQVRPDDGPRRNPVAPFETVSSLLTAGPGRHPDGSRDPREPFDVQSLASAPTSELPPPSGPPLPMPSEPPLPPPGTSTPAPPGPGPAPSPFPPPYVPAAQSQQVREQRRLIQLAAWSYGISLFVPGAAGVLFLVAGFFLQRAKQHTGSVWAWSLGLGGALMLWSFLLEESPGPLATFPAIGFLAWSLVAQNRLRPPSR